MHLQRLSGSQMTMKRTPRLSFKADPAIAAGSRVEELLRGLHARGSPRRRAVTERPGRAPARHADERHRPGGRRQGGGLDLARRRGTLPPHLRAAPGRPRGHARPRRHGRPAGRLGPGHPSHALPHRAAQDLHDRHRARHAPPRRSTPPARSSPPTTCRTSRRRRWRRPRRR